MTWKALQNFTSFRQNNKLWWLHVMSTWNHQSSEKFHMAGFRQNNKLNILHVVTWNHQSSQQNIHGDSMLWHEITSVLQNFTSFRQNNKLWWLHVITWNHQIILATGYAFFRVVGVERLNVIEIPNLSKNLPQLVLLAIDVANFT